MKKDIYCMVEIDSSFSAEYINMIGLLAKFDRASNSLKNCSKILW